MQSCVCLTPGHKTEKALSKQRLPLDEKRCSNRTQLLPLEEVQALKQRLAGGMLAALGAAPQTRRPQAAAGLSACTLAPLPMRAPSLARAVQRGQHNGERQDSMHTTSAT